LGSDLRAGSVPEELAVERIARLYMRDRTALAKSEDREASRGLAEKELASMREVLSAAISLIDRLSEPHAPEDQLFGAVALAASLRSDPGRVSNDDLLRHLASLEVLQDELQGLVATVDRALEHLRQLQPPTAKGRGPDIALTMLISRAATHWLVQTGEAPPKSKSDPTRFNRFIVEEILPKIPEKVRPQPPSPSRISRVLDVWCELYAVFPLHRGRKQHRKPRFLPQ
jgi:hypothetical protein